MAMTIQKMRLKRRLTKKFAMSLDFDFYKHPVNSYDLREDLLLGLN